MRWSLGWGSPAEGQVGTEYAPTVRRARLEFSLASALLASTAFLAYVFEGDRAVFLALMCMSVPVVVRTAIVLRRSTCRGRAPSHDGEDLDCRGNGYSHAKEDPSGRR
jgi:hypothetical protein